MCSFAGLLQGIGALLILPFFIPLANRLGCTSFLQLLRSYLLFNGFLLFWGCLGHYVFIRIGLGRLYVSVDRVVDFLPFVPFGQWVLGHFGDLRGHVIPPATFWQLRLIWLAVAIPVWLLTYASTFYVARLCFHRTTSCSGVNGAGETTKGRLPGSA